jgi:hypothetical protein
LFFTQLFATVVACVLEIDYHLGDVMMQRLKSKVMVVVMLVLGFVHGVCPSGLPLGRFFQFSSVSRLVPLSYIKSTLSSQKETMQDLGVFSLVGATTFGGKFFLAPFIPMLVPHVTGIVWCGALLYVLAKNNGIIKKVDAIHDDTQELRKDTAVIKGSISATQHSVTVLTRHVDDYHQENIEQFEGLNGKVDNLDRYTHEQFAEVRTNLGHVEAGVKKLGAHVENIEREVAKSTADLSLLKVQTNTLVQQSSQTNDAVDKVYEELQITGDRLLALQLEGKRMLEAQERQNKTINDIAYLAQREKEREIREQESKSNGVVAQKRSKPFDGSINVASNILSRLVTYEDL